MADRVAPGPAQSPASIREAVCVHTRKIFDSCRDKDCVDDLRVYPTESSQAAIDNALSIRPRSAELLEIDVNVEPVSFNRGYYTVDCSCFYRVTGEAFPGGQSVTGLCIFDKRVMLFGSVGSVKVYASDRSSRRSIPSACTARSSTASRSAARSPSTGTFRSPSATASTSRSC